MFTLFRKKKAQLILLEFCDCLSFALGLARQLPVKFELDCITYGEPSGLHRCVLLAMVVLAILRLVLILYSYLPLALLVPWCFCGLSQILCGICGE